MKVKLLRPETESSDKLSGPEGILPTSSASFLRKLKSGLTIIENMAENQPKEAQQVILCEMCTDEDRKPARKTCMKCEISMCVQHLQAHLTTPVLLQTHPLTEPMAICGTTKCPQHGKLLEYYCLDDLTCVCVSCAIEDQHRLHNMKTLSTAHRDLMETLTVEQAALEVKTDDENVSLEKWEKNESEKLAHYSVRLIDAVKNLRDVSLTSIQSSVSARMVSIRTAKSSMRAAQNEKDTFRFLQMYAQVHQNVEKAKAVDLRKGLESEVDRVKLVNKIGQSGEKMVKQAGQLCEAFLTLVDPENHQGLFVPVSDLKFEPQSLGSSMAISKDGRKVFYNSWMGDCGAILLVRSTQPAANFQRWLVSFSKETDWIIGLCNKKSTNNPKDGPIYALHCQNNKLSSLTTDYDECSDSPVNLKDFRSHSGETTKTERKHRVSSTPVTGGNGDEPLPPLEIVEVFWNFAASSLSFFRRTGQYQRKEILTIKMSNNNWDLVPFVQLRSENGQDYISGTQSWRCPCGVIHKHKGKCHLLDKLKCSCGEMISYWLITEMVCELKQLVGPR